MKNLDSATQDPDQQSRRPPKIQIQTQVALTAKDRPKTLLKGVFFVLLAVILVLGALVLNRADELVQKIFAGTSTTFFGRVWETLRGASGRLTLAGENRGQINILLLGIGGEGHEGPYLTDTMIVAQIRPKNSEIAFVSIPRDLLAELPGSLGQRKVNAVFTEGLTRTKDWGEAGRWSRQAVERISGLTIPYFAVVDFKGFKDAIDAIGGLDIQIERSFTDAQFPNEVLGFLPPVTFEKGLEHMDGTRALQFARSRHGNSGEGSDFARSMRQQKVMKAFKDKILKLNVITGIGKINSLLNIFSDNFHTNLGPGEMLRLHNLVKDQNIQTFLSLNLGLETGLVCPTIDEATQAYILVPCPDKTSSDIHNFFKNSFALGKLAAEKSVIWLADSTHDPNAYKKAESRLKEAGLTVWQLNYEKDNLPQTLVFQANPKPATLEYIKNTLSAREVSLPPPQVKADPGKVDIIVILGKNN